MKRIVSVLLLCFSLVSVARADRDPEFEAGLVSIPIEGNQVLPGPGYSRPQLVYRDTKTGKTIGGIAAIAGGLSLVGGWVVYIASQNYRLRVRTELGDAVDSWETQRRWALTLGGFGAANLTYAEYALLPPSKSVPGLAWIGGIAGVGVAAVGVGFVIGGSACSPIALAPGAEIPRECLSGTADRIFGIELLLTSLPLINLPLTYAMRSIFSGAPESLTFTGTGMSWSQRF